MLVALAVLFIAPVVFVVLTSLMSSDQTLTASIWPKPFDVEQLRSTVFQTVPLLQWFGNSALYAVLATLFMLLSSVPAAYALAKIQFRGCERAVHRDRHRDAASAAGHRHPAST